MTKTIADKTADPLLGVRRSVLRQSWELRAVPSRISDAIAVQLGISPITAQLIAARGISIEDADQFYRPSLKDSMPDPRTMKDVDKATGRIISAINKGEKIAIFGDYDVDGATASAVLSRYFQAIGIDVRIYIPDRMQEGYGPNAPALLRLRDEGFDLVITVDCGILSFEPLAAAENAGLDVIVVDHHKAEVKLPKAAAVVNPNRLDDDSGLGYLAAVGVAFLLLVDLNRSLREAGFFKGRREPDLRNLLDIVALGTVADVVPLVGLNRALVKQGFSVMSARRNAGLTALSDVGRISEAPNAYHAGYILGPRVNAGGRVGESQLGADLLTCDDPLKARMIAEKLDKYNNERRIIEAEVLEAAMQQLESRYGPDGSPETIAVAYGEGWHAGVIGIVASRIKDKYGVPALVIALESGEGKGSGRSISGVDFGAAVIEATQRGHLIKGGGHAMAAGLSVSPDKIQNLISFLEEMMAKQVKAARASRSLKVDAVISLSGATAKLIDEISEVGPFGAGNPSPRFAIPDVDLLKADLVGENHLRCIFKSRDGLTMKVMAFRQAYEPLGDVLRTGQGRRFHIAGRLQKDTWGGSDRVEMTLDDAALVGPS